VRILGIDQSLTKTGWCLLSGTRAAPEFSCGHFSSEHATSFAVKLVALIEAQLPDFVCWERPNPRIMVYGKKALFGGVTTPNADQLVLPQIAGMIEMACVLKVVPYESVAVNTWRARVLGKGSGNLPKAAAKKAAVAACKVMKIPVKNADQAEAALIALYAMSSDQFRLLCDAVARSERDPPKTAQNTTKSLLD
jgi:Holliday junction resolvasome RuvABC endonuclease subunit